MHTKKHTLLGISGMLLLATAMALLVTSEMLKTDAILISAKWTKEYVQWTGVENAKVGPRGLLVKNTADPETYGMALSSQQLPSSRNVLLSFGASGTGFLLAGLDDGSTDEEHATYGITVANGKAQVRHGSDILTETPTSPKDRFQIELQRDRSRIVYRKNGKTFFMITEDTRKVLRAKAFIEAYQSALSNVALGIQEEIRAIPTVTPLPTATPVASPTPSPSPASTPTPSPSPSPTILPSSAPTPSPIGGAIGGVELPRTYLKTSVSDTSSPGQIRTVAAGGDLQAAINAAQPGDKIVLTAGATYTGVFVLPKKNGASWVTITTAGFAVPEGRRVGPADAPSMAKIASPTVEGAVSTATGAHHYRFIGVEFKIADNNQNVGDANGSTANTHYGLVRLGDANETVLGNQASNIILDRVYIHGHSTRNLRRCVALNSASTAIIDSYLAECHEIGSDSQAIGGWNGPGPFKIVNNYLEGAGENLMFGGSDSAIRDMNPSDIEIRGNHFKKPLSWMVGHPTYAGYPWTVKNLLELKTAKRVLIEGNIFENSWPHAQVGMAINLKSANQDGGAPWAITQDVSFTNNIVKNAPIGMTIHGHDEYNGPTLLMNKVRIANNIFDNLTAGPLSAGGMGGSGPDQGRFIQVTGGSKDITLDHNTVLNNGSAIVTDQVPAPNFTFTNNILNLGPYGIKGDGMGSGNDTITTFFPNSSFAKNAMVGSATGYPTSNFYPATYSAVGFTAYNNGVGGNYRLTSGSVYKNAGTDGKDLGADIDAVVRATACTLSGACSGG